MNQTLDRSLRAKQDRIQEVRRQETEWAKKSINDYKKNEADQKSQEERLRMREEYQAKLTEMERLKKLREEALIQIGEAQRKAAEQKKLLEEQERQRQERQEYSNKMAQTRFKEAQEWKKQSWMQTDEGKHASRISMLKETSMIEKQKEQSLLMTFKLNGTIQQQTDYNTLLEKSKKAPIRPEDFAKTCFHNPVAIKHNYDEQKENAIDKANSVFIESQSQLEQTAKQWRDLERSQRERGLKALSKERQKKVVQEIEQDTKFLKKHQLEENIKSLSQQKKKVTTKTSQETLSKEFNKMFVDKSVAEWKNQSVKKPIKRERSLSATSKERPKSVKIFTKKPLDSGLYKPSDSERVDYTNYPLSSPDLQEKETTEKKKVKFVVPSPDLAQSSRSQGEALVQEFKQSKDRLNVVVQQQEDMQKRKVEEQKDIYVDEGDEEVLSLTQSINQSPLESQSSPSYDRNQITDMKSYIKEQESYLEQLEKERLRITNTMKMEEQNLQRNLRETRKMINQQIPEESLSEVSEPLDEDLNLQSSEDATNPYQNSGNTYKNLYETDDQSQLTSNPSYTNPQQHFRVNHFTQRTDTSPLKSDQRFQSHQYTFQNPLQKSNSPQNYTEGSPSALEYSPESKDQSGKKFDNFDTSEIMKRFLKPSNILVQEVIEENESPHFEENSNWKGTFNFKEVEQPVDGGNLSEIFQKRKAELSKRLQEKQQQAQVEKSSKGGKTKEELHEIRKQMMKRPSKTDKPDITEEAKKPEIAVVPDKKTLLMQRLAMGQKVQVDKQEMLALTAKNYEQLPEVQKRKIDQDKRDDFKRRQEKVKELDQKTRQKLKA